MAHTDLLGGRSHGLARLQDGSRMIRHTGDTMPVSRSDTLHSRRVSWARAPAGTGSHARGARPR